MSYFNSESKKDIYDAVAFLAFIFALGVTVVVTICTCLAIWKWFNILGG